ncbi:MgtC/SapB family protein [Melaminivora alkalimesophila]|uniref:Protein MgtC n=1 Tax=Melaminivora alkalimesophila TaxID=1165852 RepID=A0A317R9Q1_9BURK|nr:MgtC/SapB family protein [Melaminivora alkalimesophila]PWW44624.1 putative Mg2+ transporter-C (MgtC) family protein [Melaminivora alkalimesophila]
MSGWWSEVLQAIGGELADAGDPVAAARTLVRLGVAAALGGLLGWEREHAGKAAGVRTHMLVSMGAALFVLVAEHSGIEPRDNSRVLQGVIAGIGFLGTGTILKRSEADAVEGLTTAAGIWFTAAIGVTAGLGHESMALLSSLLGVAVLWALPRAQHACHLDTRHAPPPAALPPPQRKQKGPQP